MTTMTSQDARITYAVEALAVATRRNILTTDERETLAHSIAIADVTECYAWAGIVTYDLAQRCRSFVPAELVELRRLGALADAA